MKIRWSTIAALPVFLVWPTVAQNSWTIKATVSVPFDFVVNGTTLPAGYYRIMTYSIGNSLLIQNVDQPDRNMIVQNRNEVLNPDETFQKETKLIFLLKDGQHTRTRNHDGS